MSSESSAEKPFVPLLSLIAVFSRIGITSFGGSTAAWLYSEIVQRRGWLDEEHFITALTLSGGFATQTYYSGIYFYCQTPCTAPTSCP